MGKVSVRYIVDDVDAAVRFYTGHLGFQPRMRPAPGFAALERGDVRLLLNAPGAGGAGQAMPDATRPEPGGWNRIQLEVEDLAATVRRLKEQGAGFRNEIVEGQGGRQILIEDPSHNVVELFEPRAKDDGERAGKAPESPTPGPEQRKLEILASTQSDIKALLDGRCEAMRTKDTDRLMSLYSPDIVYFDLVPPLRYAGAAALRARFVDWFGRWQSAIGQELRDVNVSAGGDFAAAHMLVRASGTLKNGREVGYWIRVTNCVQRSDQRWLITHEHVSLPVDMATRSAAMDLVP
jgi:ketosteroid isomerase-like protein/catechol 2,3-dioxygenase-like lactoylglutathione lyase family enzyme